MNKRIKELAKHAGVPSLWTVGTDQKGNKILEKFAELLIRECAMIYEKIDNGNLHEGTDDYIEALDKTFRS